MVSQYFSDFINKYRICFIVPSMKIQSYRYGEYLQKFLPNSNLCNDVPDYNDKDIIIIVPTKSNTFENIHHSIFLTRKYKKFPKSIIIVVGFDSLISMDNSFDFMSILSSYKIPILYTSINDERVIIDIKLTDINDYKDCVNYNKYKEDIVIHIIDNNEFIKKIKELLLNNNGRDNYLIYCYYNGNDSKNKWMKIINNYLKIIDFFYDIMSSGNMELKIKNDRLIIM